MAEKQTCPRRMNELGPWEHEEGLDKWERRRLCKDPTNLSKRHWFKREPFRRCSFCGGIHPEDVIRLINEGAETETTYKNYKVYLQIAGVPGCHKVYFQHFTREQLNRAEASRIALIAEKGNTS